MCVCVCSFYNGHDTHRRWRNSPWISACCQLCGARVNRIDHAAWLYYMYIIINIYVFLRKSPRGDASFPTRLCRKDNMKIQ